MKKFSVLVILLCFFSFCGCSVHQKPLLADGVLENSFPSDERVLAKEKLTVGGKILVVPFSAGENVEASDQLDHVSLMIVKGIADVLSEPDKPLFTLLGERDAQSADFVIKGRIAQMQAQKHFQMPWEKKSRNYILKVDGSVLGVDNDEIVAKFSKIQKAQSAQDEFEALGYQIGQQIGRFLLSSAR